MTAIVADPEDGDRIYFTYNASIAVHTTDGSEGKTLILNTSSDILSLAVDLKKG